MDRKKNCFKWAKDSIQACVLNKKIDKIQLVDFFGWGSWIRTNEVTESESVALPLGDTPILFFAQSSFILTHFLMICNCFSLLFKK